MEVRLYLHWLNFVVFNKQEFVLLGEELKLKKSNNDKINKPFKQKNEEIR